MTAARSFGRVDAIVLATSKLRQVWLSVIAMLVSAFLALPSAYAAPGDVDALNLNIVGSFVYASAVQPDGKTIIGGSFSSVLGQARNNIARLNADGTLDAGFNPNANGSVESVALQADGQILLGGFFTTIAGSTRNRVARVAADGTLDTGFNPNANGNVRSIAVQADGQILLGGDFTTVGGSTRNRVARVAANGTLDVGFNPNANATVYSIAIQADGQILLGGSFITIGGSTRNFIARVAANGTLDASFTPNANFDVISIAVQANGQILFVGFFTMVNGVTRDRIARVAANGTLDMGFNPVPNSNVFSIALQADGRILFGGEFTSVGGTPRNRIARVAADGMLDAGFNPNVNGDVRSIALQADGQILLGDVFTTVGGLPRNRFARLLNDPVTQSLNAVDTTQVLWTRGGSAPELGQATFELSTNGGVSYTPLGGTAMRVGSTANWQLSGLSLPGSGQLRARGRTAGGFGNGSSGLVEQVAGFSFAPSVSAISPANGSTAGGTTVTITGTNFTGATVVNIGGAPTTGMVVLSPTSITAITGARAPGVVSVDVTTPGGTNTPNALYTYLGPGPGTVDALNLNIVGTQVYASAVQPDGKTIIGGVFGSVLGQARNNIARLNADGTLDVGFNPGANALVYSIAVQADGQILLGGSFTSVGGSPRNNIARVAANGTLDAGFNPNANSSVESIAVQADGQILLGGEFTTIAGSARSRIARVAANGTLDAGFNPDANGFVYSIAVQADGQILLGGNFTTVGGSPRNRIARLAANGTLDAGFDPNPNPISAVYSIAVQADGQILLGGNFTTVGGSPRNSIARLAADGTLDAGFNPNANNDVFNITVQADGQILLGGGFTTVGGSPRNSIARVAANGTLDAGFNPGANNRVYSIALQANGQILLGGDFTTVGVSPRNVFARLLNDPATQSLSAVDTTQVLWTRGGSAPDVSQTTFELSTNGGVSYTPLGGTATRVGSTANWQLSGLSLPASGQVRARGRTAGGFGNGSTGLVEQVASFLLANNAPSFIAGPNQTVLEDAGTQSIAGWATAIDDGEPLAVQTLTFVVTPISGTVNFSVFPTVSSAGTLSYTTDIDSVGSATFSVRLDDDGGTANGGVNQSALQNFTISVGPVNDAPGFGVGAAISPHFEDPGPQSVPGWAIAVDDGDPETVQTLNFVVTPISGTLNFSMPPTVSLAGTLSYTPAPNSFGSATFSVRLDDNGGTANGGVNQSALQNLTINVGAVNDAPTFVVGANQSVSEDVGAVSVPAWASTIEDGDPETVQTLNFVVTPISGTVNFSVFPTVSPTGTLSYTTDIDSVGSATFSVRLDDDGGTTNGGVNQSADQTFTISVGPVNDAPSFGIGAAISPHFEDPGPQSVPGWAIAVDDGDPETVQTLNFVVTPISGTLNFSMPPTVSLTGTLSYTPAPNSFGSATFSVRLDDNGGTANGGVNQSAALNFTIDVFAVNDAPTFVVGANQTTFEDVGPITVPGWATVDDGDPEVVQTLSFEITAISGTVNLSAGPTISPSGTLSYTAAPNSFGSATITIRVNDDGGLVNGGVNQSATQNFTISVIAVNDAPSFVAGTNQNVLEDAGSVTVPGWATAINWNDGGVVQSVTFAVTPISGTVNFSVFPTITPTGQLSYTPAPNSAGSATFAVVAMDNGGTANGGIDQSPPQNFTINVGPINDAPSFVVGANQSILEDAGAISVPAWASALDDGDAESVQNLNFTLISNSNPTLFSVAPSISPTGALSYTSVANASGSATISLRLDDDGGTANGGINQSAVQNFTITVAPVNDLPSFVVGANQTLPPGSTTPQTIPNWASAISDGDPDFVQSLTFEVANGPNSMFSVQPTVSANGTLTFTPNGSAGRAMVGLRLTDDTSAGGPAISTIIDRFEIVVRGIPTVTIEQRSPAATVVGEPFSVRVRVLNPTSSFQATGMITVALLPSGNPVQCTLAPIATPLGAAEAICNNVISPIATAKLVLASYNGDAVFALGEGLSQHPVDKAATRLTILEDLPDPSMSNSPVAVRYLLEVLPPSLSAISDLSGDIRLSYGQTDSSLTPFSSTNPIALITMQGNGSNPLTASYTGDGNFLDSTVATPEPHMLIGGNNSDLAVAISNSRRFVPIAGETIYQVRVSNLGSISSSAQLDAFEPEGLDNYRWTCSASAGSSCHAASGNGTIVAGINILAGGNVTYTIRADVSAAEATLVRNSVRITPSLSPPDANPANNTATDTDIVAVFVEGFEE